MFDSRYQSSKAELDLERAAKVLTDARKTLENNPGDPGLAVELVKCLLEMEAANLDELAWLLASGRFGCSKNDVVGLFDHFQRWLDEQEES